MLPDTSTEYTGVNVFTPIVDAPDPNSAPLVDRKLPDTSSEYAGVQLIPTVCKSNRPFIRAFEAGRTPLVTTNVLDATARSDPAAFPMKTLDEPTTLDPALTPMYTLFVAVVALTPAPYPTKMFDAPVVLDPANVPKYVLLDDTALQPVPYPSAVVPVISP
jgi:hypothetical protein